MSGHTPWREIKHKRTLTEAEAAQRRAEMTRYLATTCAECHRSWDDPAEPWRAYLTVDDVAELFCPECAAREFGE